MGNQSPTTTLRAFVEAVWTSDDSFGRNHRREVWSKPDIIGDTRELRRFTTRADKGGIRTDFF